MTFHIHRCFQQSPPLVLSHIPHPTWIPEIKSHVWEFKIKSAFFSYMVEYKGVDQTGKWVWRAKGKFC